MNDLKLPNGTLKAAANAPLVVRLRAGGEESKKIRAAFDRLAGMQMKWMMLPARVAEVMESAGALDLEYPAESAQTLSLSEKADEWGRDLPAALPAILGLARFTLTLVEELFSSHQATVPPLTLLRYLPGSPLPWRMLPVPAPSANLADWARADAEAWLWLSPRSLLGSLQSDPVHALGAALHLGLTGGLFPEILTGREKFARLLRGRVGQAQRLESAVKTAVPRSLAAEAARLSGLVLDCLDVRDERRPSDTDMCRQRFADLEQKLTLDRLMQSWEYDNRPDVVRRLKEAVPAPSTPGAGEGSQTVPAPQMKPPPGKEWNDVARDLLGKGDLNGALEAAWNAVFNEGPIFIRLYLGIVQIIAARSPLGQAQVAAALERITQGFGQHFSESNVLHLMHLKLRYLHTPEQELGGLDRPFESRWNEGICLLLQARVKLVQGQDLARVSKLCQEGRKRFESMPQGGGHAGSYALSYLYLLDGIAHIRYVAVSRQTDYYADALERFGKSFDLASKMGATEMILAGLRWLGRLAFLTRAQPGPLSLVYAGSEAILRSQGAKVDVFGQETPEIPWYDDTILFAL